MRDSLSVQCQKDVYKRQVLGCGVDVCYPREHIGLYVDILEQGGGIISEMPPGTPPFPQNFPDVYKRQDITENAIRTK